MHIFSDHLLFNSILNFVIIVNFFINSILYIFVPYIASDFYNTSLPTFNIMHRSVFFHRTFGDLTQTCAFFNFNVFNVLPTQEGDFCVWCAGHVPHVTFRGTTSSTAHRSIHVIMSFCDQIAEVF